MSEKSDNKVKINLKQHYLSPQRLSGLDLARFLAMVMMIQGHVIYALAAPDVVNTSVFPWNIWHYVRGLTAPVFLFVSGAVHVFANKRDEKGKLPTKTILKRIRMASLLIFIGYLMQLPVRRIWDLFSVSPDLLFRLYQVNILQLFGVSLIFLLFVFIITRSEKTFGILSFVVAFFITFINPYVHSVDWFNVLPDFFASYLSTKRGSIFPIFPFTAFLFYGAAFGAILKSIKPENRTTLVIIWGIFLGVLFFFINYLIRYFHIGEQFITGPLGSITLTLERLTLVFFIISATSFIYLLTPKLSNIYSMFSKHALFIYVVHLMILYGTPFFDSIARKNPNSLNLEQTLVAVFIVEFVSIGIVFFYEYSIRKYPKLKRIYLILLLIYLAMILFI